MKTGKNLHLILWALLAVASLAACETPPLTLLDRARPCELDTDCLASGSNYVCVNNLCVPTCVEDEDCKALGNNLVCVDGACLPENELPGDNDKEEEGPIDGDSIEPDADVDWVDTDPSDSDSGDCLGNGGFCREIVHSSCGTAGFIPSSIAGCTEFQYCCVPETTVCLEIGQTGPKDQNCCPGLTSVPNGELFYQPGSTAAICLDPLPDEAKICLRCGNGVCGAYENFCNCPVDCPIPSLTCGEDRDCGDSFCITEAIGACTQVVPYCDNSTCVHWSQSYENSQCMVGQTCLPNTCTPGETVPFTCWDGSRVNACSCNAAGSWSCVEDPYALCPAEPVCDPRQTTFYRCPDGTTVPECTCDGPSCRPICTMIGSRSEGWYDSCLGGVISFADCVDCTAVCRHIGTASEGFYSSCDDTLILAGSCGTTWNCVSDPSSQCPVDACSQRGGTCIGYYDEACPPNTVATEEYLCDGICCLPTGPSSCESEGGTCYPQPGVSCPTGQIPMEGTSCGGTCCISLGGTECEQKNGFCVPSRLGCPTGVSVAPWACEEGNVCCVSELQCRENSDCGISYCTITPSGGCAQVTPTCENSACSVSSQLYPDNYNCIDNRCQPSTDPDCNTYGGTCFNGWECPEGWSSTSGVRYSCGANDTVCCWPDTTNDCVNAGGFCSGYGKPCPEGSEYLDRECPDGGGQCCYYSEFNECEMLGGKCQDSYPCAGGMEMTDYSCGSMSGICCMESSTKLCERRGGYCSRYYTGCQSGYTPMEDPEGCVSPTPLCCEPQGVECYSDWECGQPYCYDYYGEPGQFCVQTKPTCEGGFCSVYEETYANMRCDGITQQCVTVEMDCEGRGGYCTNPREGCTGGYYPSDDSLGCKRPTRQCCLPEAGECQWDGDCGEATCYWGEWSTCIQVTPYCADGTCSQWEEYIYNAECMEGYCVSTYECYPGEVQQYYCESGAIVNQCTCSSWGTWDCVPEPEALCPRTCDDAHGTCSSSFAGCSNGFSATDLECDGFCIGGCVCCTPDGSLPCTQMGGYCNMTFEGCQDGYDEFPDDPLGCPSFLGIYAECCVPAMYPMK